MNKKLGVLILSLVMISVLALGFVAAIDPIESLGNQIAKLIEPANRALHFIVGDTAGKIDASTIFLSKILLLILIISLVSLILDRIPILSDSSTMKWVISIVVGILGIRFLSGDIVAAILLPYNTMAIAMSIIFPFIIYGAFVYSTIYTPTGRRIAWAFFGLVFLFIWFMRASDESLGNVTSLYPLAAAVSLGMMLIDGTIARLQKRMAKEKAMSVTAYRHYLDLLKEYETAEQRYTTAVRVGNAKAIAAAKSELNKLDVALSALKV